MGWGRLEQKWLEQRWMFFGTLKLVHPEHVITLLNKVQQEVRSQVVWHARPRPATCELCSTGKILNALSQ